MSYWGNLMAEQEADDYLMSLGDGERRELMEDFENKDDITHRYANPEVTKAFDILDGKEVDKEKEV